MWISYIYLHFKFHANPANQFQNLDCSLPNNANKYAKFDMILNAIIDPV